MKSAKSRCVFFEPWSLGDVIIAAATLRELEEPAALACHSMWHPLLRSVLGEIPELELIAVNLPYTTRLRGNPFDTGGITAPNESRNEFTEVLSIRGDLRDFASARRSFPRAHVRMTGWMRFLGRKSAIVNVLYSLGTLSVENRYQSWAQLAGVGYNEIESTYRRGREEAPDNHQVAIHLGAQWRSKQYPEVARLRDRLAEVGWWVRILAGPGDPLPPGLTESEVVRVMDASLIDELRSAAQVITNDSGPMHVAAFLGCRTHALVRTSPIEEWAPPAVQIISSPETPRGYRPHPRYMSDEILSGWPQVDEVINRLSADKSRTPTI